MLTVTCNTVSLTVVGHHSKQVSHLLTLLTPEHLRSAATRESLLVIMLSNKPQQPGMYPVLALAHVCEPYPYFHNPRS